MTREKHLNIKERMKLRFKFRSGNITVRSNFQLTEEQKDSMVEAVNNIMVYTWYEPCRYIASEVYHRFEKSKDEIDIEYVFVNFKSKNLKIYLKRK